MQRPPSNAPTVSGASVLLYAIAFSLLFAVCAHAASSTVKPSQSIAAYYKEAELAIERKQYAEALKIVEQGLAEDPAYMPFLRQRAVLLQRLGKDAEAARAISLALAAMPDDVGLNALAVDNIITLHSGNQSVLQKELAIRFQKTGASVLPSVAGHLMGEYQGSSSRQQILKALDISGVLQPQEREVTQALVAGQAEKAATALGKFAHGTANNDPRAPLVAALCFVTASSLKGKATIDTAEALMKRAASLGYDPAKVAMAAAESYIAADRPKKAVEVLEQFWLHSSEPSVVAVKAAKAHMKAGDGKNAVAVLGKSLGASPNDPFLQGHYYALLVETGSSSGAASFADRLQRQGADIGYHFGKYLAAVQKNRQNEANEERTALLETINSSSLINAPETLPLILETIGTYSATSPQEEMARRYRTEGWTAWEAGRLGEAYKHWKDALELGLPQQRDFARQISQLLVNVGMTAEGRHIYQTYVGDGAPPVAARTGTGTGAGRQRALAVPGPELALALSKASSGKDASSWQNLILAQDKIQNGMPQEAEEAVEYLMSGSMPQKNVNAGGYTLTPSYFQQLLTGMVQKMAGQGRDDLAGISVESRLLKALPDKTAADLYCAMAFDYMKKGRFEKSAALWETALKREKNKADAHMGLALTEKMAGREKESQEHLRMAVSADPTQKAFLMAKLAVAENSPEQAVMHLRSYLEKKPTDYSAYLELFRIHMSKLDYNAARDVRDELAYKGRGDSEAAVCAAICDIEMGRYLEAEKNLIDIIEKNPRSSFAIITLSDALKHQGRLDDARELLKRANQKDPDQLGLWRSVAEEALKNKDPIQAQRFAELYLAQDPDSAYMHSIYGESLLAQGKTTQAEHHATSVLARNDAQPGAQQALLDIARKRNDLKKSEEIAKDMAEKAPYDPNLKLQAAVQSTGRGRFGYGFEETEKMSALGPNASTAVWLFANISANKRNGAFTPEDIERHIKASKDKFKFIDLNTLVNPPDEKDMEQPDAIPALLIIGSSPASQLRKIDAILEKQRARAALLVGEESFVEGTPVKWPSFAVLRELRATGRWDFILTDNSGKTVVKDASGKKISFWGGPAWINGQSETPHEMTTRMAKALGRIKQRAHDKGFPIMAWMYPGGDFGQIRLDSDEEFRAAYTATVTAYFPIGFVNTATGYHLDGADLAYTPVRFFYSPLTPAEMNSLGEKHPSRHAVLDEARLASWHGQTPRAEKLLVRASEYGLSQKDITYLRAVNAKYAGDVAQTNILAMEARRLDPHSPKTAELLREAVRMRKPHGSFAPRYWSDSDDRKYMEYKINLSGHVTNRLAVSANAATMEWKNKDGTTSGEGYGVGLRYYAAKEHWADVGIRKVNTDADGRDYTEWFAAWHGSMAWDFLALNGTYDITFNRGVIETREAVEEGIYANRMTASASLRYLNWGVFEFDVYGVTRSDGNDTRGVSIRPGYILFDRPFIKMAYHFDAANSDRNPSQYYAPVGYQSHTGGLSMKYEIMAGLNIQGHARYGWAKTREHNWRGVFRYGGGLSWDVTDHLTVGGSYEKLKLPGYDLDQLSFWLNTIF